ncbi:TonB-dependent receptor [Ningiella sp. W23]|uniref:TonB-dependent receptor n=1 Tax=Ningiella sp. W23 TaxID=3023715 RepID=UPI0039F5D051
MKNKNTFNRSLLALSISSLLGTVAAPALAQDASEDEAEVIEVRGIRSSLSESASIKRNSIGVVDAISAEDIGKFPDTNLAESLQRITGVSISRTNGEGSEVTVRGFGGSFNMITLNGRMMPAASAFGQNQGGNSRAFDFANIASEGVSGVEVYKTSKANIATGGIGATINLKTTRPLDASSNTATVSARAVHDTTNRIGDDVTPELSGLFSWADDDEKFGVSLSASYQVRDSGTTGASVNDWRIARWDESFYDTTINPNPNGPDSPEYRRSQVTNAPAIGQQYALPNNISYDYTDTSRTRTNAQLTLQYAPTEDLRFTADYTYAQNNIEEFAGAGGYWSNRNFESIAFDTSTPVATVTQFAENVGGTKDNAFAQNYSEQTNTLSSTGLNIEYFATDNLKVSFDYHGSTMDSKPDEPTTGASSINVNIAAPTGLRQEYDFSHELPKLLAFNDDSRKGNNNGIYDKGDLGSQYLRFFYVRQTAKVDQAKLDFSYEFDDGKFDFGIETRKMESKFFESYRQPVLGNWGVEFPMDVPTDLIEDFSIVNEFDDFDTSGITPEGFRGSAIELGQYFANLYDIEYAYDRNFTDELVEEDTQAVYFQVALNGELAGMEANFLAGVRYESTDVLSISNQLVPVAIRWDDNNDFSRLEQLPGGPEPTLSPVSGETDYDHVLPSLDFDIMLRDDVKARFSFSQTIARAGYADLRASVSSLRTGNPTLLGGQAQGNAANPGLVPLLSNNFDLSLEYYYGEGSFVSAGFFEKRVRNFIGTEQVLQPQFGLRDPTNGPRALQAAAEIEALGLQVNETRLFAMTAILDNPQDFPNGAGDYVDDSAFWEQIAADYDVFGNADDPLFEFLITRPTNTEDAAIHGFEVGGQHFFGETGFGVQANYTIVRGDVGFDNAADRSEQQFALTGLSDSANLIAFYEKDGWSARVAYNWRDDFLAGTSRGSGNSPTYIEAFSQIDLNVSYDVNENLQVFLEGINITGEDARSHGRTVAQLWNLSDLGARYQIGARYVF